MTIPSTTDDLIAEIEAAAKAAPKGNWIVDENHDEVSVSMGSAIDSPYEYYVHDRWFCESEWSDEDEHAEAVAKHIAASRPENVLTLIARIRELEQAQRWIPCSERLPDMEGDASTESAVVQIFFDDPNQNSGLIKAGFYCHEEQAWYLDYGNAVLHEFDEDPTHWMPLTEPPK